MSLKETKEDKAQRGEGNVTTRVEIEAMWPQTKKMNAHRPQNLAISGEASPLESLSKVGLLTNTLVSEF